MTDHPTTEAHTCHDHCPCQTRDAGPAEATINALNRAPHWPARSAIDCDRCGRDAVHDYLVPMSTTAAALLAAGRKRCRAEGWRCDDTGDYCSNCRHGEDADLARDSMEAFREQNFPPDLARDDNAQSEDQPDGIANDSLDLPEPERAAERVRQVLSQFGDGVIPVDCVVAPLYARDLEMLTKLDESRYRLQNRVLWLDSELAEMTAQREASDKHADRLLDERDKWRREYSRKRAQSRHFEAQRDALVEASLATDYTKDHECGTAVDDPDAYEVALANITEMHRVLLVRVERLFQANDARDDERRRAEAAEAQRSRLAESLRGAWNERDDACTERDTAQAEVKELRERLDQDAVKAVDKLRAERDALKVRIDAALTWCPVEPPEITSGFAYQTCIKQVRLALLPDLDRGPTPPADGSDPNHWPEIGPNIPAWATSLPADDGSGVIGTVDLTPEEARDFHRSLAECRGADDGSEAEISRDPGKSADAENESPCDLGNLQGEGHEIPPFQPGDWARDAETGEAFQVRRVVDMDGSWWVEGDDRGDYAHDCLEPWQPRKYDDVDLMSPAGRLPGMVTNTLPDGRISVQHSDGSVSAVTVDKLRPAGGEQ